MARPKKKGLEYFTNDVNFYQDIKIRKLIRHKGIQAVSIYHILLCQIYSNGYYLLWDEDLPFILYEVSGLQEDEIEIIVNYCIEIGLFDKSLFEKDHVLTSQSIQERYIEISVAAKRKLESNLPYLITDIPENVVKGQKTNVISEEIAINTEESPQSKVKKRKVKHSSSAETRTREGESSVVVADGNPVDVELAQLRSSPEWKEQVLMRFKFLSRSEQKLMEYLARWGSEVKIAGKYHSSLSDAKHHFCCWMTIQEEKLNQSSMSYGKDNNNGYRSNEDIINGAVGIIQRISSESPKNPSDIPVV